MARQTPVLIKSFPADAAIPRGNLCLCESATNAGNVAAPANHFSGGFLQLANAGAAVTGTRFVGVSKEQSDGNNEVALITNGIVQIESDGSGTIAAGDYVAITNVTGQVATIVPNAPAAPGTTGNWSQRQIIGVALSGAAATAGLLVDILLQPHTYMGA